jgi:hypothetical protein
MRLALVVGFLALINCRMIAAASYDGMVVRSSDSRPIAGIVVYAFLRPSWFSLGVADTPLGRCTTSTRGTFHFDLPQRPSRLLFTVGGKLIRRKMDDSTTMIYGGGAELRHPKPNRSNIIQIADEDVPNTAHVLR